MHNSPKMAKTQSSIGKYAWMGLTNTLYVFWCFECLPTIVLHIYTKSEVSVIKRRKDILSGWLVGWLVGCSLTLHLAIFQLYSYGAVRNKRQPESRMKVDLWAFDSKIIMLLPFTVFRLNIKKPKHRKVLEL